MLQLYHCFCFFLCCLIFVEAFLKFKLFIKEQNYLKARCTLPFPFTVTSAPPPLIFPFTSSSSILPLKLLKAVLFTRSPFKFRSSPWFLGTVKCTLPPEF